MENKKLIKSPLNYVGGKFKLLPQIIPHFSQKINCFYDIFGGGFNVGVNVDAKNYVYNDKNFFVKDLLNYFYKKDVNKILIDLKTLINHYKLDMTNQQGYLHLRKDFNDQNYIFNKNLMFYALICFSFNHNIRFNSKNQFNMPFGKNRSGFNPTLENKLMDFVNNINMLNIKFSSFDFEDISLHFNFSKEDFVYCDPPYLISDANYGNIIWKEDDEKRLLEWLENLNKKNIKFALSNVVEHKGMENTLLKKWIDKNNFKIHYLDYNYNNASPVSKTAKNNITKEVLVTNY